VRAAAFIANLKMKILVLTNLYPPHYLGGYELICYMVVNELRARGHELSILTSDHLVPGKFSFDEIGVERTLKIHGFYGHPWHNIRQLRHLERRNNQTLRAIINKFSPDLVYVWNMGGLSKSMVFTLQKLGIPTVYYLSDHWIARGFKSDVWIQWWNRKESSKDRAVRTALKFLGVRAYWQRIAPTNPPEQLKFQRLYFCSKALRKLTASAGFEVMHGAVIYAPVDLTKFFGEPKPEHAPVRNLLWVGRLAPDKGAATALKALALVKGRFDGTLHIYGAGEAQYTAELKNFAYANKLPVVFGSASMEQMPEIYRKHDALLFTSEWAEPFALTPLEAMASGLPVIGTTTGGSRELFRHHDNALTYTAGNAEELAARILELSLNPGMRVRLAQSGQTEVRTTYALPVIVDQIERYLKESVSTWKPPGLPRLSA
jgi:glycosyltransferase involved in cell wall biosynthesis